MSIYAVVHQTVKLTDPVKPYHLRTPLSYNESLAHFFGHTFVNDDGTTADLSGCAVTGKFKRPDNTTVDFTGGISGNTAYGVLPANCYNAEGRFTLTLFLTTGNTRRAFMIVKGFVEKNETGDVVVPDGELPADIDALLAEIDAMRTATEAANSAAEKSVRYDATQELTETQMGQARTNIQAAGSQDVADLKSEITQIGYIVKTNDTIRISRIEDGYYSTINGTKQNNSSSTTYKRSASLIPIKEKTLYISNVYTSACYYDVDGNFISSGMLYPATAGVKRVLSPIGAAFAGLHATNATEFAIQRIDGENFENAEYPYGGSSYLHLAQHWCNGFGEIVSTSNFDLLVIPNVTAGEKFFVSNDASYNCLCFDMSGNMLTTTNETREPTAKVFTVPENAAIMYVNLYRARTKGTSDEMIDYIVKLGDQKVLAIGDSITWLDGRQNYGDMAYVSGWQRQLRLAGYDVFNAGFSGYPYANGLDIVDGVSYSIYNQIVANEYDVSGYDYIILFGGTNDVLYGGELGDRPTVYSNRAFDDTKFNGALGGIISYIRDNNSTAKIILASFPKSEAASRTFLNAITRVDDIEYNARFWSCKYANVFDDMNVQPTYGGFDVYFYDSTHPNFKGMQTIGKIMLNAISSY